MPFQTKDDGFELVEIETTDGTTHSKSVDVYVLGQAILVKYRDLKAQDKKEGYVAWLVEFFAGHGFPGISGKCADELGAYLIKCVGEIEKKVSPTPSPG